MIPVWAYAIAIPVSLAILFRGKKSFAWTTPTVDNNATPSSEPPIPPWSGNLSGEENTAGYWKKLGATKAKIRIAKLAKEISDNNLQTKPTYEQFKAWYEECGKVFNVPAELIRGFHCNESGRDPKPLDINASKSTATGLGQFLKDTSVGIGVPFAWQLYWKCAVWSTAKYVSQLGWNLGQKVPTLEEVNEAHSIALKWFTDEAKVEDIPKWYRACMKYWSGSQKKADGAARYASQILGADPDGDGDRGAITGFDACTVSSMSKWNLVNESGLASFINGSATSIKG